jgi:hypothetical protein
MYCSERNYLAALAQAAPYTRYLHISDAQPGYNLKIVKDAETLRLDLDFASTLVYFPQSAGYLLVDRRHPIYFGDRNPEAAQQKRMDDLLAGAGVSGPLKYVDYTSLFNGASPLESEIFVYLISMPGLSYDVLERARPILLYLRTTPGADGRPLVDKMLANTLTGVVHFHEIPGEGSFDFAASFDTLTANGFSGYGSVELYHHVQSWEKALHDSYRHLSQFV